eukprot:3644880-Rhodomonas_salina.1
MSARNPKTVIFSQGDAGGAARWQVPRAAAQVAHAPLLFLSAPAHVSPARTPSPTVAAFTFQRFDPVTDGIIAPQRFVTRHSHEHDVH